MKKGKFVFTSESVAEGHPDKLCDQISDAVLDAIISKDPKCRVGCEVMAGTGFVHLAGEVTTDAVVNYDEVARNVISEIGYTDPSIGFDAKRATIEVSIGRQSPDISQGVTEGQGRFKEQGAGDQGLMFGYACNENDEYMPAPIYFAHAMMWKLAEARKSGALKWLRPDGKGQVSVEYDNWKPLRIDTVVLSAQHTPEVTHEEIEAGLLEKVIRPALPRTMLDSHTKYFVNPTGRFVVGGPQGDCGLTGRKIIVDTYGGWGRHGGGAFSGKDPSKVDRSASYMARYVAKSIVAAGLAERCEVQLAYAIGVAEPVSVMIDSFGTAKLADERLSAIVRELFPLKPKGIIDKLNLLRPIYRKTAAYGHFGRGRDGFSWEATDMVPALKKAAG